MIPLLQTHFETALDHPNGIKKLRELILSLAMQGKLVVQDKNDQPARELLKEVQAEKERLVKEGKIKKTDAMPLIKEEEKPFVIPEGWEWVRLGDVCEAIDYGTSEKANSSKGIPILRMNNIQEGKLDLSNLKYVHEEIRDLPRLFLKNLDLIFNRTNSYELVGKTAVFYGKENSFTLASYLIRVTVLKCINIQYLNFYINSRICRIKEIEPYITQQTNQANFSGSKLKMIRFPLPPLAEQKRIVEKVDQLFLLCDELERLKQARDSKRRELHYSVLTQCLEADSVSSFQDSFQFLTTHFHELYSVKENVKELRKAVLQLAVMGKLVAQDKNDQPARELLKEIQAEKERLVKEGKIRKTDGLLEKVLNIFPCDLPFNWEWVKLNELGTFYGGKTPSTNNSKFWKGTIPWISAKDMKKEFITDSEDHITQAGLLSGLRLIPEDSILIVVRSGILRHKLPVAINKVKCTINQDLKALILHNKSMSYYLMIMLKGFEIFILEKLSKTGMTVESLTIEEFTNQKFPLPPLAEQKRIVEKIDELLALCDRLEEEIEKAETKRGEILEGMARL